MKSLNKLLFVLKMVEAGRKVGTGAITEARAETVAKTMAKARAKGSVGAKAILRAGLEIKVQEKGVEEPLLSMKLLERHWQVYYLLSWLAKEDFV